MLDVETVNKKIEELDTQIKGVQALRLSLMKQYELALNLEKQNIEKQLNLNLNESNEEQLTLGGIL